MPDLETIKNEGTFDSTIRRQVNRNFSDLAAAIVNVSGLAVITSGVEPNRVVQLVYQDGDETVVLAETVY